MRALTVTNPWAGLIAAGIKLVENRPRSMIKSEDFGKPFAIHASREIDESVYDSIHRVAPEIGRGDIHKTFAPAWGRLSRITSAVIAVATLRDAMYIGGNSPETTVKVLDRLGISEQLRFTFGPTVYVLSDVVALPTPVPCKGSLGFWTLPADVDAKVREQIGEAR